jgi:hypothetical protein
MMIVFLLRSWHSKRLRQALESLSTPSDPQNSPKLLANPDKVSSGILAVVLVSLLAFVLKDSAILRRIILACFGMCLSGIVGFE